MHDDGEGEASGVGNSLDSVEANNDAPMAGGALPTAVVVMAGSTQAIGPAARDELERAAGTAN
jgi:hypothetical protein